MMHNQAVATPFWSTLNPQPFVGEIVSISVPESNICWAADEYGAVKVTRNGGELWQDAGLPDFNAGKHLIDFPSNESGWVIRVLENDPNISAIAFHTSDGGANWTRLPVGSNNVLFSANCFDAGNEAAIIGGYDYSGGLPAIYRFVEDRFILVDLPAGTDAPLNDLTIIGERNIWAVGGGGYCAYSANAGSSWQRVDAGTDAPLHSVIFISNIIGWIGGGSFNQSLIMKTVNGGGLWLQVEGVDVGSRIAGLASFSQSGAAAITRGTGVEEIASLLLSRNGRSWETVHEIPDKLSSIRQSGGQIWIGGAQGLLLRTLDGDPVEVLSNRVTTEPLTDISFSSPRYGWAVGGGANALRTTNRGVTWNRSENFPGWNCLAVIALSSQRAVISCINSQEWLTDDGGLTWEEVSVSDGEVTAFRYFRGKIAALAGGAVSISTDLGRTWAEKRVSNSDAAGIAFAGADRLFAAVPDDSTRVSYDCGETWSATALIPPYCNAIFQLDENYGWANCRDGGEDWLWRTADGWEYCDRTSGFSTIYDWGFVSPTEGWMAHRDATDRLSRLLNGGTTLENAELPSGKVNRIAALEVGDVWVCGNDGLIAHWFDPEQSIVEDRQNQLYKISLIRAYPNPANGRLFVYWDKGAPASTSISLINSAGRRALSLRVPRDGAPLVIDIGAVPAGVYYLSLDQSQSTGCPVIILK